MSTKAIDWALESGIPTGPRFVLFVLGNRGTDHAGEDWTCFPSVATICNDTGQSRATVERHLNWLWAEGWISRKRRVRPDGRLGIYDYQLHRDADRRAALKTARAGVDPDTADGDEPCRNLQHGPCVTVDEAMPQNGAQPCVNLSALETPLEPSDNPQSAREAGDDYLLAFDLFPIRGQKRTNHPKARDAWAWACTLVHVDQLLAAIRAFAADPDQVKGDFGACGFDRWLTDERWRAFLPPIGAVVPGAALAYRPAADAPTANAVRTDAPTEVILAAFVGRPDLGALVRDCAWNGEALIARTRWAANKLRNEGRAYLRTLEIEVLDPPPVVAGA